MTAISGSAIGLTPFVTSGDADLEPLLFDAVLLHAVNSSAKAINKANAVFIKINRRLEELLAIDHDRHRAVIYQLDIHHRLEASGFDLLDSLSAFIDEVFV